MLITHLGNALEMLKSMPEGLFQTCVTSPPYYQLRDYKTPPQIWDGDSLCDHEWDAEIVLDKSKPGTNGSGLTNQGENAGKANRFTARSAFCTKCGAWKGELGLEPTLELYLSHMVQIFREVRRTLRDDGTLWLNMGDSYSGTHQSGKNRLGASPHSTRGGARKIDSEEFSLRTRNSPGFKPKDLMMIPARLAMALQADGWWLRSDIIWRKTNPMPESVEDRPARCHEYIFLLAKSELYYYDAVAVRELTSGTANPRGKGVSPKTVEGNGELFVKANDRFHGQITELVTHRNKRTVWEAPEDEWEQFIRWKEEQAPEGIDVWDINTAPFKEAHFATFPPALAEACIAAGTSPWGCVRCHAPWVRVVEHRSVDRTELPPSHPEFRPRRYDYGKAADAQSPGLARKYRLTETKDWVPSCECYPKDRYEKARSRVLDPFGGAFTTALVADRMGRDCDVIELNPEYAQMGIRRFEKDGSLFAPTL